MIDLTWRLFSHTGNIETYLLWKELENDSSIKTSEKNEDKVNDELNTKM
ncbi:YqzL family protein [Virgibacillus phasianinus]|uniref:YqzL family protein n=1 Tax=Virgibacillus phasianinus TaxID=2017483 RepID=A0A220U4Z4_9BACI|nr:YqzL family protein [Virgibacillus phasianinus]ASK63160.1 YqzL family protein [Virgibacillus phasianinus]